MTNQSAAIRLNRCGPELCPIKHSKRVCRMRSWLESMKHPSSFTNEQMQRVVDELEKTCVEQRHG